jgi:hypothetical protein
MSLQNQLFKPVNNVTLVIFRVCFGFLMFLESIGAILTGWVKTHLIDPSFTLTFIGFEWIEPFPGKGMYYYYIAMGVMALGIMIGFYYQLTCLAFGIMWTTVYLMQKSEYNNHYYLIVLLSFLMAMVPAADSFSLDSRRKNIQNFSCPNWCLLLFQIQFAIVYIYAGINKLYPDWLNGQYMEVAMRGKKDYPFIGPILNTSLLKSILTYGGILFDLLVIPALLYKRTRIITFAVLLIFHLSNSLIFQIGIFPYTMIAATIFYFPPDQINKWFFKKFENTSIIKPLELPPHALYIKAFFLIYLLIQILLPTRPWFYPGNSHWSDEGHRMSWRMMLRSKSGTIVYKVKDQRGNEWIEDPHNYLTPHQVAAIARQPDLIWQFAQILKKELKKRNIINPQIYAHCQVSLNGRPATSLIDPMVDLSSVSWNWFYHSEWIFPLKE